MVDCEVSRLQAAAACWNSVVRVSGEPWTIIIIVINIVVI